MIVSLRSGEYEVETVELPAEDLKKGDIIVPTLPKQTAGTVVKVEPLNRYEVVVTTTLGPKFRTTTLIKETKVYKRQATLVVVEREAT